MPTPTYDLISEQVLGSNVAGITFGSGGTLTQAYRDLIIEISGTNTVDGQNVYAQVNGDTGTNYSYTRITGNGTTAASSRTTASNYLVLCDFGTTVNSSKIQFMSYANSNVNKDILENGGIASSRVTTYVNLWRSTAAITSIYLYSASGNLAAGSTFRLWGIA